MARSKPTTTLEFLRSLFSTCPDGVIELRAIPVDKTQKTVQAWVKYPSELAEFVEKFGGKDSSHGAYFGVCKRKAHGGSKKQDVVAATCLWADIDTVNHGLDADKILELLVHFPETIKPSIVVHSGGGLHFYWLLESPCNVQTQVESVNIVMRDLVGGDSVHDITRVMRLPETWNNKRAKKVRCRVVYCAAHRKFKLDTLLADAKKWGKCIYDGKLVTQAEAQRREEKAHAQEPIVRYAGLFSGNRQTSQRLSQMWRDRVREHAPRGYMGIHEAIVVTTARLHCMDYKDEKIIDMVIEWIKAVPDLRVENWNWTAERQKIKRALDGWKEKWPNVKRENRKRRHTGV